MRLSAYFEYVKYLFFCVYLLMHSLNTCIRACGFLSFFFLGIWTWHDLEMLCNAGVLRMLKLTTHKEQKLEIDLF